MKNFLQLNTFLNLANIFETFLQDLPLNDIITALVSFEKYELDFRLSFLLFWKTATYKQMLVTQRRFDLS